MKKLLKLLLDRPEINGILLGLLIAAVPLLFAGGNRLGVEYLQGEEPEFDHGQLYFFLAIPVGSLLSALAGKSFKVDWSGNLINIPLSIAGGVLTAAGLLIAGDLFFNRLFAAARFSGSGWLFICGMFIFACGLTMLWKSPAGNKKG